jgi:hypothetical protein
MLILKKLSYLHFVMQKMATYTRRRVGNALPIANPFVERQSLRMARPQEICKRIVPRAITSFLHLTLAEERPMYQ